MLTTGVYTVECPQCKGSTLIHLATDGSVNPHRCSKCEVEFRGIDSGKQRHSFVGLVKEAEEKYKAKKITVKTQKEPFKRWGK